MNEPMADHHVGHPRLLGIGTAAPEQRVEQTEAARLAVRRCCETRDQARLLTALYRVARVSRRGSAILDEGASDPQPAAARLGEHAEAATNGDAQAAGMQRLQAFFPAADDASHERGPTTAERMHAYARLAPPLAIRATRAALAEAELSGRAITHLVTVSCTGFQSPGVDIELVRQLDLPPSVQRVNVGFMGCHGALNGLATARALAAADPNARVLLCCVELCSLHFQYGWDEQQLVANALFADGAAAAVVAQAPRERTGTTQRSRQWEVVDTASRVLPDSDDQMTWRIDDHGFVMTLSPQVPRTLLAHVQPWIAGWLAEHGLSVEQVEGWAVHPGGPRILSATQQALALPVDALACSRETLRERGNMSSPTVLFIVRQLQARLRPTAKHCVMLSFGPGLTGEAALLRRAT